MSTNGILDFQNTNKVIFRGTDSNVVVDTSNASLGIGIQGTEKPGSNLHVIGDASISSNLKLTTDTSILVNSNVVADFNGPHARLPKEVPLKKYPEIIFEEGKFDANESTNTYVQAGYTVSSTSTNIDTTTKAWKAFNDNQMEGNGGWTTPSYYSDVDGYATSSATEFPINSGRRGEYIDLKLPKAIKVDYFVIKSRQGIGSGAYIPEDAPGEGYLYGSNDGSNWVQIKEFTGLTYGGSGVDGPSQEKVEVGSITFYTYLRLQATRRSGQRSTDQFLSIGELEYYGYEEDPPAGDSSLDTTFKSVLNTPQTTGANVYVDAKLSSDFTNRVTGPTPTGTATTYNETGKYWELTGALTSNVTVEANTFLEGDQPHAVSVWFNSSNLEANTANTCVFTISDQENLDSYNLDLQSNTWHNLTYSYQGEGGSRVTYLDGRKVAEDQAEDTFGDYPPFAMTGFSQGGYVVNSARGGAGNSWKVFNNTTTDHNDRYYGLYDATTPYYLTSTGNFNTTGYPNLKLSASSGTPAGDWISIEMPYKLKLDTLYLKTRSLSSGNPGSQQLAGPKGEAPRDFEIWGTNDSINWYLIKVIIDAEAPNTKSNHGEDCADPRLFAINASKSYKKFAMIVTRNGSTYSGATATSIITIGEMSFNGHRENDLVRLPDPTHVLRYPHISMIQPDDLSNSGSGSTSTEVSKRGYTVTGSSSYTNDRIERAFRGGNTATDIRWRSELNTYTTNGANGGTLGVYTGSWLKLELPHKIVLSQIKYYAYHSTYAPESYVILASNNDTDWVKLHDATGQTNGTFTISSFSEGTPSVSYKYYAFLVRAITNVNGDSVIINDIQYFGTEEASSVPIQIGGGNIDKVANFRVYDKFIDENQALEIWDAQKDEFGRAKSSMTLHKGRLGIGTTEPEGRLAVLDEPHNLEEFPPRAMTDYKTYFEGHGEFCVRESSYYSSGYEGWRVFDEYTNSNGTNDPSDRWTALSSTSTIGSLTGKWVKLELPYRVNFSKVGIFPPSYPGGSTQCPTGFSIIVSNDDETWTTIKTLSGYTWKEFAYNYITFENDGYFKYIAIVATTDGGSQNTSFQELKYFGTREQRQSVLHDGQLTLTKNLDVPRIGPPLDADDTPRRDRLVVEYNTSTNLTFEGAVRDTSGRGLDGVFTTGASYDAIKKALTFNGATTSGISIGGATGVGGDRPFSVSLWFNASALTGSVDNVLVGWGAQASQESFLMSFDTTNNQVLGQFYGNAMSVSPSGGINLGNWYHAVLTYPGGGHYNMSIYVNGVKGTNTNYGTNSGGLVPEDSEITIGTYKNTSNQGFNGSISNFKLYDVALTPSEAKTLYDMGRCDEGHHVVNFSKTRVGIGLGDGEAPTYTLDVRGEIRSQGSLVPSFTGQHKCVPEEPVEKGLIVSASQNKFVKLNGGLDSGKSAITIDESLPVVSLSSVAKDKACFGVVSSMEEANSLVRVETVGGVISDAPKTLGDNRAIVNSVGEGAIWVVNTGGSLESGDYITTSNVAGYGQKQEDDVLHNYTVAKITMDCDFTATEVPLQVIKREETGLRTITEDEWNTLVDYDRSSTTETQYSNTLEPEAYTDQPGYTPREVTTIVDYTDGTNTISVEEWSNLESNIQSTYQSNTFTEIMDYIKFVTADEWSNLTSNVQNTFSEAEITTYYQIQRGENVLDENGQLQWEDKTGATEAPYERRFLDASGAQTDEANAVHIAAFVGCTYHCG